MVTAPSGHVAPQHPQPLQAATMTSAKPFSPFLSAPYGHTAMHVPHPVHLFSSTTDVSASACTYPLAIGMAALDAAAAGRRAAPLDGCGPREFRGLVEVRQHQLVPLHDPGGGLGGQVPHELP